MSVDTAGAVDTADDHFEDEIVPCFEGWTGNRTVETTRTSCSCPWFLVQTYVPERLLEHVTSVISSGSAVAELLASLLGGIAGKTIGSTAAVAVTGRISVCDVVLGHSFGVTSFPCYRDDQACRVQSEASVGIVSSLSGAESFRSSSIGVFQTD